MLFPSGNQAPALARMFPNRRGEPAGSGTDHKGASRLPVTTNFPASNCEWSAEISSSVMDSMGTEMKEVSPPPTATWASTSPSGCNCVR